MKNTLQQLHIDFRNLICSKMFNLIHYLYTIIICYTKLTINDSSISNNPIQIV